MAEARCGGSKPSKEMTTRTVLYRTVLDLKFITSIGSDRTGSDAKRQNVLLYGCTVATATSLATDEGLLVRGTDVQ